jgi:hypothetical protein
MQKWCKKTNGWIIIVALLAITAIPTAYAAIDITSAIKLFGVAYVVDMFQTELNDFVNAITMNSGLGKGDSTKVVPILSAGTGAYIGAAQVSGPYYQVAKVQAVAQLEGDVLDTIRAKVLIPLDSKNPLQGMRRVSQVGVSAIIDITIESAASPKPVAPTPVPTPVPTPTPSPTPVPTPVPIPVPIWDDYGVSSTLQQWPAFGYAIFAQDDIVLRGNNLRVTGAIRANDDVTVSGNNASFSDVIYAHDKVDAKKGIYRMEGVNKLSLPTMNWHTLRWLANKTYGGNITLQAGTQLYGVTTVDGDLMINGALNGGGLLVVRGNLLITSRGVSAPNDLLIWVEGDVSIEENNANVNAFIIAGGKINVSGNNVRIVGGLIGDDVTISGNNINLLYSSAALRHFPR